jgi:prevent-host-death family protein
MEMHSTFGAEQVASVTELRTDTMGLINHANEAGEAILIQRNNEPCGVLIGIEAYKDYVRLKRQAGEPIDQAG